MQLVERIVRGEDSRRILEGAGPLAAQAWEDYRHLGPMLSEKHSTALFMADQAAKRGERNKRFETDVAQSTIDSYVMGAATILRKLDKDIQLIMNAGGNDAIIYLKTLSTLRDNLTGTIEHFQRLIGK